MCELFAMQSRAPATVRLSLAEFARHGGLDGPHKDGWGVGWYEDGDVRLVKEPHAASDSACLQFLQQNPFRSTAVISHIRHATQGRRTLANTQPFVREMGAHVHLFAHNGDLDGVRLRAALPSGMHHPVGETDSEYAFCALLEMLRPLWLPPGPPPLAERLALVARFAAVLRPLGPANFLYADGDAVFAHGHRRTHADGMHPPGLHVLCRRCAGEPESEKFTSMGLQIDSGAVPQEVVLFASVPLTRGEPWRALAEGELLVARGGRIEAPRDPQRRL